MTRNQIAYQQTVETNRANVARETETHRANLVNEAETARANKAREAETARSNIAKEAETNRSNLANESIEMGKLSETTRTHKANEAISWYNAQETKRANAVKEAQGWSDVQIRQQVANQQGEQVDISQQQQAETERHNLVNEAQTLMHYVDQYNIADLDRKSREAIAAAQRELQASMKEAELTTEIGLTQIKEQNATLRSGMNNLTNTFTSIFGGLTRGGLRNVESAE